MLSFQLRHLDEIITSITAYESLTAVSFVDTIFALLLLEKYS